MRAGALSLLKMSRSQVLERIESCNAYHGSRKKPMAPMSSQIAIALLERFIKTDAIVNAAGDRPASKDLSTLACCVVRDDAAVAVIPCVAKDLRRDERSFDSAFGLA